jgi:hypothetical protein
VDWTGQPQGFWLWLASTGRGQWHQHDYGLLGSSGFQSSQQQPQGWTLTLGFLDSIAEHTYQLFAGIVEGQGC